MSPDGFEVRCEQAPALREDAYAVRIPVFVTEQQIAREEEVDEHDDTDAVHCVGYEAGVPVAAGRLVPMTGGTPNWAKIGRMAVLPEHRGKGYGMAVLAALELAGAERGIHDMRLSAQMTARGFYDRAGYEPFGDIYDEVGIPHIEMRKRV